MAKMLIESPQLRGGLRRSVKLKGCGGGLLGGKQDVRKTPRLMKMEGSGIMVQPFYLLISCPHVVHLQPGKTIC